MRQIVSFQEMEYCAVSNLQEELLRRLPEDHYQAFVMIETWARDKLQAELANLGENESAYFHELEYIVTVLAAAKEYEVKELIEYSIPLHNNSGAYQKFHEFRSIAGHMVVSLQIRDAKKVKKFTVFVDAATKTKLRHLLEKMRKMVDGLDLSVEKKERLYARILDLQEEIDRDRTRLERLGALMIEVATIGSHVAQAAEPLTRFIERISVAIGISQQEEERKKLAPPLERKRITPPSVESLSEGRFQNETDDEIPF